MDVENLDALNPAELDELLERALNPQVPVELLYAVLERIGPAADARGKGVAAPSSSPDAEQTTVMPPLAMSPQPQSQSQPPRGAATDRAVRPERPKQQQGAPPQKAATSQLGPLKQPKPASAAAPVSRGAHAPSRRVAPPSGESAN